MLSCIKTGLRHVSMVNVKAQLLCYNKRLISNVDENNTLIWQCTLNRYPGKPLIIGTLNGVGGGG